MANQQHREVLETLDVLFAMTQAYINAGAAYGTLAPDAIDEAASIIYAAGISESVVDNLTVIACARALASLYASFVARSNIEWAEEVWQDFMAVNAILRAELWEEEGGIPNV